MQYYSVPGKNSQVTAEAATLLVAMIIAVDTGGTKTLVALMDADGHVVKQRKFPTPPQIPDYLTDLTKAIDKMSAGESIKALSIALPGTIINGTMVWGGNLGWRGFDAAAILSKRYKWPIFVENDANVAGLAETKLLKTIPNVCLYVTIGTGVGTGIITDGRIDPAFAATEGGQIVLEHDGILRRWETFASGKAIHQTYGKMASEISDKQTWYRIAKNTAVGLMALVPALRPEVIIIGGGVGAHFDKFDSDLIGIMREHLPAKYMPLIRQAANPEEAVLYGCYYSAIDRLAA